MRVYTNFDLLTFCNFSSCELCANKFDVNASRIGRSKSLCMFPSDKVKGVKTVLHDHELLLSVSEKRIGWFCSSLNLKQKCYRNHKIAFDVRDHDKYCCPDAKCNFALCDLCTQYYSENSQNNPDLQQQLEVQFAQIKILPPGSKVVVFPEGVQNNNNNNKPQIVMDRSLFGMAQSEVLDFSKAEELRLIEVARALPDEKKMMVYELLEQLEFELEQTLKTTIYARPNIGDYYLILMPELESVLKIKGIGKDPKVLDAMKINGELVKIKKLKSIISS